jgi:hypothetical protein
MIIQGQSKSVPGLEALPPLGDSQETLQYPYFDKVKQKDFGIMNEIGLLFSQSDDNAFVDAQQSDSSPWPTLRRMPHTTSRDYYRLAPRKKSEKPTMAVASKRQPQKIWSLKSTAIVISAL